MVMPAKNAQNTIASALLSTLRNLPKDSQIVVWDDGSTDQTLQEIDRVADSRVEVKRSETSVGGGAARAALLKQTDSEFVANMDADDYCLPWRFGMQQKHIRNLDISFAATVKFTDGKAALRPTNPLTYGPLDVSMSLAFHNAMSHPSMYARREALEKAGGYRNLTVAQDYDLWLRAATVGLKMGRLGMPCVGYRQNENQVSRQGNYEERIRSQEQLVDAYFDFLTGIESGIDVRLRSAASTNEKIPVLEDFLSRHIVKFRPSLRIYYSQLVKRKRLGPLTLS